MIYSFNIRLCFNIRLRLKKNVLKYVMNINLDSHHAMQSDHYTSAAQTVMRGKFNQDPIRNSLLIQFPCEQLRMCVFIALRRFLHNHGNIVTEGIPKPGLCPRPTLIANDFKGFL